MWNRLKTRKTLVALAVALFFLGLVTRVSCGRAPLPPANPVAAVVLGQLDFTKSVPNLVDAGGLVAPTDVAVDEHVSPPHLFVVDSGNHRVLGYRSAAALRNGATADLVLGQPDFYTVESDENYENRPNIARRERLYSPSGVAVDRNGTVFVSDAHNRILIYKDPFTQGVLPAAVLGQTSFTGNTPDWEGVSARTLFTPQHMTVDAQDRLWVADSGNNRVLMFSHPLEKNTADLVLGQEGKFTTGVENISGKDLASLRAPTDVAFGPQGELYVADGGNRRLLRFSHPEQSQTADLEYVGIPDLTAKIAVFPQFLAAAPNGELLLGDSQANRLYLFALPLQAEAAPRLSWGQEGEQATTSLPTAGNCLQPQGGCWDRAGNFYLADSLNHRVLIFDGLLQGRREAAAVLGQERMDTACVGRADARSLYYPVAVAVDRSVRPNRLYVTDSENNRVLGFADASRLVNAASADLVLGQADLTACFPNCDQPQRTAFCIPSGLAVDAKGNLYVADRDNSRVLIFKRPFATDTVPDMVLGQQGDYTTAEANRGGLSARSLNRPEALAVDSKGGLFVADTRNHRVLHFKKPLRSDQADAVWGQQGRFDTREEGYKEAAAPDRLSYPFGLTLDGQGNLWVADTNNHRVLVFPRHGRLPGQEARWVFGQKGNLHSAEDNLGGGNADSLSGPQGVCVTPTGDAYIADTANSRVLHYTNPLDRGTFTADIVYGQKGNFFGTTPLPPPASAESLYFPYAVDYDSEGNLYVADKENSRVLVYRVRRQ